MKRLLPVLTAAVTLVACSVGLLACSDTKSAASTGSSEAKASPAAKKGGTVLARFGDQTITSEELTARLNESSPYERASLNTLEKKQKYVENLARFALLAEEAQKRGFKKDPEVVRAMQTVMVKKLIEKEIDDNPAKKKIPDAELQAYYQAHLDDFVRPEMIRLSAIFLDASGKPALAKRKTEAQKLLADLKTHARDYSAFGAMARAKSDDAASKQLGGDLRFLSAAQLTQRYGAEVATAGFALKNIGDLAAPVETDKGIYVLKLAGRTPALDQTFEQVKSQLESRLWYERRGKLYDQLIDDLKKKEHYTVDDAALEAYKVDANAPTTHFAGFKMPEGMMQKPPPAGHPGTPRSSEASPRLQPRAPSPAPAAPSK